MRIAVIKEGFMHEFLLVVHFLGLVMGLGTGFAHAFIGFRAAKMEKKEREQFLLNSLILSKMGMIGLVLLLLSGGGLLAPYLQNLMAMPLLIVKLALVLLLTVLVCFISHLGLRVQRENDTTLFDTMEKIGKVTLPMGIVIVVIAVVVFK